MAVNPSQKPEALNNPMQRANEINDPQFSNEQGYFPYDLTHQEIISPLFGQVTPSMHLLTAPGDRIVMQDNTKLIRNQINGNLLSKLNQYIDSFFVSMRTMLPNTYEKLIVNPTKGDDLPNSALPQIPFSAFVRDWWYSTANISFKYIRLDGEELDDIALYREVLGITSPDYLSSFYPENRDLAFSYAISRVTLLATILSRGQLLDYLGVQYDSSTDRNYNALQYSIDRYFDALASLIESNNEDGMIYEIEPFLTQDSFIFDSRSMRAFSYFDPVTGEFDLSRFRSVLSDLLERGKMFYIKGVSEYPAFDSFLSAYILFRDELEQVFTTSVDSMYITNVNTSTNPFEVGHISPLPLLAYQLCIAQYFTNNSVDNIFNSDLYMQLLRAVMFPNEEDSAFTKEPTFNYNGVSTEYDYASAGAFYYSLLSDEIPGRMNRGYVYSTLMFLLRRSLRYGDYFSTARPRMLAVGQLGVNVENGLVSPIDITRNLLMQRYLNAANYIGSGFLPYFASIYGVTPSDTSPIPRYVSHRTIEIGNQVTNNTADNQGAQTTNLIAHSDDTAYDVFIDDHGILLNLMSFDVLPVYTSGIDSNYHLADRFDFFNPMLQNIGDEPIKLSELQGNDVNQRYQFGWTMRNKDYKFKVSRAHGFFNTSESSGYLVKYPYRNFVIYGHNRPKIDSDFIRDKPYYLDSVLGSMTGVSPATYWHFLVSCTNVVQCARKIQATPPVLF